MSLRYWYFISNRATHQCIDLVSDSPEGACREIGWQQGNCVVITVGKVVKDPAMLPAIPPQARPASPDAKRQQIR